MTTKNKKKIEMLADHKVFFMAEQVGFVENDFKRELEKLLSPLLVEGCVRNYRI